MSSIPKIIHQIWLGPNPLPEDCIHFRETVLRHHPSWVYSFYRDTRPLEPPYKSYASKANVIRLQLLKKYGGVYLDTDVEAISPLDSLLETIPPGYAFAAEELPGRICGAILGAPLFNPWIDYQVKLLPEYSSHESPWGVELATLAPRETFFLVPTKVFYPFLWDEPKETRKPAPETILIHHWNKSWWS